MTEIQWSDAAAVVEPGGPAVLRASFDLGPADYNAIARARARRFFRLRSASLAGVLILLAWLGHGTLMRVAGAILGAVPEQMTIWPAIGAALRGEGAALGLLGAGCVGLWLEGREAGRLLAGAQVPPDRPIGNARPGLTLGPQDLTLIGDRLRSELALYRTELHLRGLGRASAVDGQLRLMQPNAVMRFYPIPGGAHELARWVVALRHARAKAPRQGWPLPEATAARIRATVPPRRYDAFVAAFRRAAGVRRPPGLVAVAVAVVTRVGLFALLGLAALGLWGGGAQPVLLAATACLAPISLAMLGELAQALRIRLGLAPWPDGAVAGLNAGPLALEADPAGLRLWRSHCRLWIDWEAAEALVERDGLIGLVAGGAPLEVVPAEPALRAAIEAAGFLPDRGPWTAHLDGWTWYRRAC